ncbi:MAG: SDR family oxidoreductase [candidate division KSB1 bacterium]|nr:SDR family oxidoreductase [candidate division KSB1 bacterium]
MASYLVTGGAGFIGSNLVHELVRRGEHVRVLDDLSTGRPENLRGILDKIEFIEGDICDEETVRRAMYGMDYVLHQAALPSVQRSVNNPIASNRVNVNGTLTLLMAAREQRVKRFVIASSSSVYGDTPVLPKVEDMPINPLSPYATSKLAAEKYAMNFYKLYGLPTVALRYFNVFGPRQNPKSQYAAVIPKFITAMLKGELPVVYGDGEQSRDFTFIENVVQANLQACHSEKAPGHVVNIACGQRYSLNDLLRMLERVLEVPANAVYESPRPGDVKHSLASIELARDVLDYKPQVSFEEGLRRTVAWYQETVQETFSLA